MASGSTPIASVNRGGGQAFGPGPRRWAIAAGGLLLAAAAAVTLLLTGSGGHAARHGSGISASGSGAQHKSAASLKYGQIPAWLPKPSAPADQIVVASADHPALAAVEGDTVNAHLGHGSAMVTAVGPAIPRWVTVDAHSGHLSEGGLAPATFTVTFAVPRGIVALNPNAFSILTNQGQIFHPAATGPHGSPLPVHVTPGQGITLTLKVGLGEGDGALRWAPDGPRVLVAWFYQLEFD
jgi:hypothetical protein